MEKQMKEERKFLEQLAVKNNGLLMVDDVLEAAKDEACILHKHFEWDDTEAAAQYRRTQARSLIQKCRVEIAAAPDVSIRAFVSLQSDQASGGGYRMTAHVLGDADMKAQLLDDIHATISRWGQRLHLLDHETVAIIERLEASVKRHASKTQESRVAA
jgi:hypothetical protein